MCRTCLECSETFNGRTDKKFCSDFCRNVFNNRIKASASDYFRKVNSILRKNYKILGEMLPEETARATKAQLLQKGFNFNFYTDVYTTQKGSNYYFCYEYGYLPIEKEQCYLVKRREAAE